MINSHIHIFNYEFTPDDFLKIKLDGALGEHSDLLLRMFNSKVGRYFLRKGSKLDKFPKIQRYAQFLNIGLYESQYEILKNIDATYAGHNASYIVLSLNLDHMSDMGVKGGSTIETQLAEIMDIKRIVGDKVKLFLSVDPRHKRGADLDTWIRQKFATGYFSGFKIYPALGFYPFDPGLEPLYKFADEHSLPITTHCTRYGAFFVGKNVWNLIGEKPASFNVAGMQFVYDRINRYRNYNGPAKKEIQKNAWACNLFSHPDNYVPILDKYRNLKLCIGHFGGGEEVLADTPLFNSKTDQEVKKLDCDITDPTKYTSWFDRTQFLMQTYDNCYADISYTLANPDTFPRIALAMQGPVKDKILFGTDFFMELQNKDEPTVLGHFLKSPQFTPEMMEALTIKNPTSFLKSK